VRACGNLKYDLESESLVSNLKPEAAEEIDNLFALSCSPRLIIAGSTAPGEEKIMLAALGEIRRQKGLSDARLILAPRHPERFDEVAGLIAQSGFRFARRSEYARDSRTSDSRTGDSRTADLILLDTIGELAALYRFAAVVFVGGSLVPRGGHNIIEPALYAKPIIVGPHTENFRQIVSEFAQADAVVQIRASDKALSGSFTTELIRLLSDTESAQAMGLRAREILHSSRGATECAVAAILELIN
jgi:3-deoxy-D-manno-octulosonic-acid transferase